MKKLHFLLTMIALLFPMSMTQSAMAKKIIYLGHEYNGKVNKQKIPEGQGTINVGDLLISGIFNDRSVTDAEVISGHPDMPHNCRFNGTVTYDESNNIVLKADGIFSTRYLQGKWDYNDLRVVTDYAIKNMTELKDTLKEDRIVNSTCFELREIQLPYTFEFERDDRQIYKFNELGIPNEVLTHYTLRLRPAWIRPTNYQGEAEITSLFALDNEVCPIDKLDFIYNEDRALIGAINRRNCRLDTLMIRYPDGSYYFTCKGKELCKIVYPDGKDLEIKGSGYSTTMSIGNGFEIKISNPMNIFIDLVEHKSPLEVSKIFNEILLENIDYKGDFIKDNMKHPDSEVEELIIDMLKQASPHIKFANSLEVYSSSVSSKEAGWFTDGKYISRVTREKNAEAEAYKKAEAKYNNLCKRYGKKFVDAAYDGKFLIGMPLELLDVSGEWKYRKVSQTANTVTFDAHYNLARNPGYRLYLTNNKITRIYQYQY